jgi:amino-acid N-acetyltransferase
MRARKAFLPDAHVIHEIVLEYSQSGVLIPRSIAELCENIRDFTIIEDDDGTVLGCGALHLYGLHLAEIRSIVVPRKHQGKGAGRVLIDALLAEAEQHKATCVCLFTLIPEFFAHLGFQVVDKKALPDKIYKDCINCPKLDRCDEVAMYRGELPNFAILPRPENSLVDVLL